jgi:hypothetical protein
VTGPVTGSMSTPISCCRAGVLFWCARPVALCAGQLGAPLTTDVIAAVKNAALQRLQKDLPEVYNKQGKHLLSLAAVQTSRRLH